LGRRYLFLDRVFLDKRAYRPDAGENRYFSQTDTHYHTVVVSGHLFLSSYHFCAIIERIVKRTTLIYGQNGPICSLCQQKKYFFHNFITPPGT